MPKRRRSNKSKYMLVSVILIVVVIILTFAFFYRPSQEQKPPVNQYLKASHTASIGTFSNQNKTVKITHLGLNITAIGGDAHSIIIQVDSQADPTLDVNPLLKKGESWFPVILLRGYTTGLNAQGKFPVEVDIGCSEAGHETITLNLDPEDIVGIG